MALLLRKAETIMLVETVLLVVAASLVGAAQTPEYVKPCNRTDPNIDSCIKHSFNHLRPYLQRGIPELGVPVIEPLVIHKLSMENGNGAVRVRASFYNVTIVGGSNYTITSVKSDVSKYRVDLGISIPKIEVTGKYDISGNILLFPVRSRGEFWAAFHDIVAVAKIHGKEVIQGGQKFMRTEKLLVDFDLGRSRFRIKDYVNGGSVLGEAMNQFLNQNANEIIKEMKPAASLSIGRHFKEYLNGAFLKIPIPVWLHDA